MKKTLCLFILAILCTAAAGQALSPGKDTMLIRIVRDGYTEYLDFVYAPYTAWWVEDSAGNLVKVLFTTLYNDDLGSTTCGHMGYFSSLTYFIQEVGCPPDGGASVTAAGCPAYEPVDGVSGCTERITPGSMDTIVKRWDLTDQAGNRIVSGRYSIYYSAVAVDEEQPNSGDKVWRLDVRLNPAGFDTLIPMPVKMDIGNVSWDSYIVREFRAVYGGTDSVPGNGQQGGTFTGPNRTPDPPTAARPVQHGFCGNGSAMSACIVIMWVVTRKKILKLKAKKPR